MSTWRSGGEHVLVGLFQQIWRSNLFMLSNENANNKGCYVRPLVFLESHKTGTFIKLAVLLVLKCVLFL